MTIESLNGPQTTGRTYRYLSAAEHDIRHDVNVAAPMRDDIDLLTDVHRPDADGRFPVLVAASPYPRQIQDLGAPMGFIEAGNTPFWVSRGYVHVVANVRGTGGSGGEFGFFDAQERRDMHDLVEWAAAQPWSDGNVGMIGISYFAMTQLEAAVEKPPHLKAIFPVAVTADLFEAASHHGLVSSAFVTPFLSMMGLTAARSDEFWRSIPLQIARKVLHLPQLHRKFGTMNGEAAITMMHELLKLPHDPHPWDDLWLDVFVNHPVRDGWWDERDLTPLLEAVDIPVYLGCDWENVPLHLPSTFTAWKLLAHNPNVRMGMLDRYGLTWPWESLHTEALAWYDHWLKGRDTGILDGEPIRYALPGADGWHASATWPPEGAVHREYALRADGVLAPDEGQPGERDYLVLGDGLGRAKASPIDPPAMLTWISAPLDADLDVAGAMELRLVASATAADTAWIATLRDVDPAGKATDVTAGWLRASLRELDEDATKPGAPVLPCRTATAVPIGDVVEYRIPLVPNARRFAKGHSIEVVLTSDDRDPTVPAIMNFRHANVGTSSRNTVCSSSRLLLPVLD